MSHYIVLRKRKKDGHKVALTIGASGAFYAPNARAVTKFFDADSAAYFADFCEATLETNVAGTEFEHRCLIEYVQPSRVAL